MACQDLLTPGLCVGIDCEHAGSVDCLRIVEHCLQKSVTDRYQSALDVRNELRSLRREVSSGGLPSASMPSVAPAAMSSAGNVAAVSSAQSVAATPESAPASEHTPAWNCA